MDIYTNNQEDSVEIPGTHNQEVGFGKFDTHRSYQSQKRQGKAAGQLPNYSKLV